MFSLTGGGKYNFLGTKRWIEENLDHAGVFLTFVTHWTCTLCEFKHEVTSLNLLKPNIFSLESSLLHDNVAFVLCLDTLASGDELYMHVSRPPKPETPMQSFVQHLEEVTSFTVRCKILRCCVSPGDLVCTLFWYDLQVVSSRFPWLKMGLVHKKINLVESTVAWEHERYSLRRIPGFTLSHLEDPKSGLRCSILDTV